MPVLVSESKAAAVAIEPPLTDVRQPYLDMIHEFRKAQVQIEGSADPPLVRVLLECLRG